MTNMEKLGQLTDSLVVHTGNPGSGGGGNGWEEWGRHVLVELRRLNECVKELDRKQDKIREEIAELRIKAGMLGLIAGAIPVAILILLRLFSNP